MEKLDLNSIMFNELISRDDLLMYTSQEQIYSHYLGEKVDSLGVFHSPLREDNIPSFALYFHRVERGVLMFKDFATGDSGDFVVMVMKMFNLSYYEALWKIAYDMNITNMNVQANRAVGNYTKIVQKEKVDLGVKLRPWELRDKIYWSSFGIKKSTLKKFNVHPICYVFYNNAAVKAHNYAYVYVESKDGSTTYKIYQPYEAKNRKWINNANYTVHQGYTQLPIVGDLLIITKSLKDVMALHDAIGISSVGLQSESVMMKDSVMEEYKSRFKKVICLFDNDEAGKKLSVSFTERYNVPHIFVPELPKVTDFSDLVKAVGQQEAVEILKKLIKEI